MGLAFGFFVHIAANSQISAMFGAGLGEQTVEICWDIVRIALCCGALVPALFLPWVREATRLFGASQEVIDDGFNYISITLGGSILTCLYMGLGGCLQGEGRTLFLGIANVITAVLNMALFDPLLILKTNLGIKGCASATLLSEGIPMLVLFVCYMSGIFSIKPKLSGFLKPFNPRIKIALKVGFSQLIAQLAGCIPTALITYYMGTSTTNPTEYEALLSSMNISFRFSILGFALLIAVTSGYLPAASYSYSHGDFKRFMRLTIHAIWINFSIASFFTVITLSMTRRLLMIFSKDELFLHYSTTMLTIIMAGLPIATGRTNATAFLQSLQMGSRASLYTFCSHFLGLVIWSTVLNFALPNDPEFIY
jgi:Na+-driven multidrug efflux pump